MGAVVATFTVTGTPTGYGAPAICSEALDRLQLGAGDTAGVMVQLRLTVPVKNAVGATARSNFAACPALTV
jgi:hypothetical protein